MSPDGDGPLPLLLVTNDDGIEAPGLWDLVEAVRGLGEIAVVAPAQEQSWAGRAHRTDPGTAAPGDLLRVVASTSRPAPPGAPSLRCCVSVASTPARCVRLALTGYGLRPAILLSGINPGNNGGALLTTSGTLGAAWEAAGSGIPAVAISRPERHRADETPRVRAEVRAIVARVLAEGLPAETAFLNVNFPERLDAEPRWVVTTTSSRSQYGHLMTPAVERAETTIWDLRFLHQPPGDPEPDSDLAALRSGDVSITLVPARHGLRDDAWIPAERRKPS